jgi:hypothetical protein
MRLSIGCVAEVRYLRMVDRHLAIFGKAYSVLCSLVVLPSSCLLVLWEVVAGSRWWLTSGGVAYDDGGLLMPCVFVGSRFR